MINLIIRMRECVTKNIRVFVKYKKKLNFRNKFQNNTFFCIIIRNIFYIL